MIFIFIFVVVNSFFYNSSRNWKCNTKTCTFYYADALITVANDAIEMLPVVATDKTINNLSKQYKQNNVFTKSFAH